MKLKEFDNWYSGLQSYWTDKITSEWIIPSTEEYPQEYWGQNFSNINLLISQAISELSPLQTSYSLYQQSITNGTLFQNLKDSLIQLYTFVAVKEMKFENYSRSFTIDSIEFSGYESSLSWFTFNLPEYSTTDNFFTYAPVSGGEYNPIYTSEAILVINSNAITGMSFTIEDRIRFDQEQITTFNSSVSSAINEKIIFQMFAEPDVIMKPQEKIPKKVVLYDFKVKEIATIFGWDIPGITS